MYTATEVISRAQSFGLIENSASKYSEPGYSLDDGKHTILFANWNPYSFAKDASKNERLMSRLADIAERAGCECEWSDEWTTCDQCGGAVRTSPDSYCWKRSYQLTDAGDTICHECLDPAEYLESIEGNPDTCSTFDHISPADHGYTLAKEGMEHGWHPGQNDSPQIVAKALGKLGVERFLFTLDSVGQFDASFSVWVHESETDKLSESVESALPYDPGTEMAKALRGEHSEHYTLETREITPEQFVSGEWLRS